MPVVANVGRPRFLLHSWTKLIRKRKPLDRPSFRLPRDVLVEKVFPRQLPRVREVVHLRVSRRAWYHTSLTDICCSPRLAPKILIPVTIYKDHKKQQVGTLLSQRRFRAAVKINDDEGSIIGSESNVSRLLQDPALGLATTQTTSSAVRAVSVTFCQVRRLLYWMWGLDHVQRRFHVVLRPNPVGSSSHCSHLRCQPPENSS